MPQFKLFFSVKSNVILTLKLKFHKKMWHTTIIPAHRRQRQDDYRLETNLGYIAILRQV
jgi:hypothetical protein